MGVGSAAEFPSPAFSCLHVCAVRIVARVAVSGSIAERSAWVTIIALGSAVVVACFDVTRNQSLD